MSISRLSKRSLMGGRGTIEGMANQVTGAGDPYWDQVVLAMPMTGSIVDLKGSSITPGTTIISSTQKKFGLSSAYFPSTGYVDIAKKIEFGSADFTIDTWVFIEGIGTIAPGGAYNAAIVESGYTASFGGSTDAWVFQIDGSNTQTGTGLRFTCWTGNAQYTVICNANIQNNRWVHIAIARSTSAFYFFIDGAQIAVTNNTFLQSTQINSSQSFSSVGALRTTSWEQRLKGYIQDLRITKGIARYTANFMPPERSFPTFQDTSYDPFFAQTALLIRGEGENNATNTIFMDSSPLANVINRVGDVTQGTFSPFPVQAGREYSPLENIGSAYFDGAGDYLRPSPSSNFTLGTGDFTIEMWAMRTADGMDKCWFSIPFVVSGTHFVGIRHQNANLGISTSAGMTYTTNNCFPLNAWTHIAVCRSSGVSTLFVNGVLQTSAANNLNYTGDQPYIGADYDATASPTGYLAGLHVIKGLAKYSSNFPIPLAPAQPIPSQNVIDPLFSSVALLISGDGADLSAPIDISQSPKTLTLGGNIVVRTAASGINPVYGTGMLYFDGAGDHISVTIPAIGTQNYCIEAYVYLLTGSSTDGNGQTQLFTLNPFSSSGFNVPISSNQIGTSWPNNWIAQTPGNLSLLNTWTHVAISRSGSNVTIWVNGVQAATGIDGNNKTNTLLTIGSNSDGSGGFKGYMKDVRLTIGNARRTTTFTPPGMSLLYSSYMPGTTLLLKNTNAAIRDETGKCMISPVGAKIQTAQSKWGNGALYFDGASYINSTLAPILTEDFTIDAWIFLTSYSTDTWGKEIYTQYTYAQESTNRSIFSVYDNQKLRFQRGSDILDSTASIALDVWTHVAVTRSGRALRLFINGVGDSINASFSGTLSNVAPRIGALDYNGTKNGFFSGYMQDIRITKGIARYHANFTPPPRLPGRSKLSQSMDVTPIAGPKNKFSESNKQIITEDVLMDGNFNYLSAGPVTINTGNTVTVAPGSQWVVI